MNSQAIKNYFHPLFVLALIISLVGLANLYSATQSFGGDWSGSYFFSQIIYMCLGIAALIAASRIPPRKFYVLSGFFYVTSLVLLALVFVLGVERHGSLNWLQIGPVSLQPSEFAKLGLVFILSRYFADLKKDASLSVQELIRPFFYVLLPMALVMGQNDFGTSLFFGFIFLSLVLIQGISWRWMVLGIVLLAVGGYCSYHYVLKPYQKNRIVSFLNPELDPRGSGYHLVQSKIAVGSAGLTGKGYLRGQSHRLKFLPERHTDFAFPVFLEEWGFLGGVVCLIFYFVFFAVALNTAARSEGRFGFFLTVGVTALFFWHVVINLGGVLGLLPLTGVTLPFFSYGGSSLVMSWMAVGVLISVHRQRGN